MKKEIFHCDVCGIEFEPKEPGYYRGNKIKLTRTHYNDVSDYVIFHICKKCIRKHDLHYKLFAIIRKAFEGLNK